MRTPLGPSPRPHAALFAPALLFTSAALAASACHKSGEIHPTQNTADLSQIVVKVGDNVITVGDVQERINKQSPFIRARYTTVEKKKEFLDNLVRFEVMAAEAQKRGYDKDPEVQRVMKQQMISKFLQKDFESKLKVEDVPEADVEKYYNDHPDEFNKKDEVRVSEILVKDKAKAEKVYAEAKAQPKTAGADQKGFRDLVTKYSEDEDSKTRGGDLTFFNKDSTTYPKAIIDASFKLSEVGDVSPPVKTDKGLGGPQGHAETPGLQPPAGRGQAPDPAAAVPRHAHEGPSTRSSPTSQKQMSSNIEYHDENLSKIVIESGMEGTSGGGLGNPHMGLPGASWRVARGRAPARRAGAAARSAGQTVRRVTTAAASVGAAVAALLASVASGCRAEARLVEKIAAVVGDNIILASEVEEKAAPMLTDASRITDPAKRSARATALRREVLERLIDDELILQQATELKLSVTSEQVDQSIDEIKKQNNITDDQLKDALRGQGMTMTTYRADLKRQLLRYRVLNIAVGSRVSISDDEVKAYYERHMKTGENVQVRASHIFVAIPEGADASVVAEKQAQAQKLLERARAGEDFAKLAKQYSDDAATRADGGDLGTFGKDMLPKAIEELVFSMKVDEIAGPVRADRGFHVIKLVERKVKDAKPLADVQDDIRIQLRQKEMERQTKTYLAELRRKTLVDVRY